MFTWLSVIPLAYCFQPAAPREDAPELSAFLRNSTIPHLVRKRDVPGPELHRQSPAKILVSYLGSRHAQSRGEGPDWTELPTIDGFNFKLFFITPIGVTVANKIKEVSGILFYNTSSVYCTVCSPPQVKSPSITIYSPLPSSTSTLLLTSSIVFHSPPMLRYAEHCLAVHVVRNERGFCK